MYAATLVGVDSHFHALLAHIATADAAIATNNATQTTAVHQQTNQPTHK